MLERMRVRNFQRHEDFRVVFDERATTFVGTSDAGKSSILRALRWVTTNQPSGSAFVRHGAKEASASLWLDGRKLSRRKGKGTNKYVLDEAELEAFGCMPPSPVKQLCNVGDANFQEQHDPPFWLSLTAGQASRELNAVVNLDEIDRVLAAVLKAEKKAKIEAELCEKRADEAELDRDRLSWVPEMEAEWRDAEEEHKRLDDGEGELERVRELLAEAGRLRRRAEAEVPDTSELDAWIAQLKELEKLLREVKILAEGVDSWKRQIVATGKQIEERQAELDELSGGICPLCGGAL